MAKPTPDGAGWDLTDVDAAEVAEASGWVDEQHTMTEAELEEFKARWDEALRKRLHAVESVTVGHDGEPSLSAHVEARHSELPRP